MRLVTVAAGHLVHANLLDGTTGSILYSAETLSRRRPRRGATAAVVEAAHVMPRNRVVLAVGLLVGGAVIGLGRGGVARAEGTPEEIKGNAQVQEAYLGGVHAEAAA